MGTNPYTEDPQNEGLENTEETVETTKTTETVIETTKEVVVEKPEEE
jgi:hypothetical protein